MQTIIPCAAAIFIAVLTMQAAAINTHVETTIVQTIAAIAIAAISVFE